MEFPKIAQNHDWLSNIFGIIIFKSYDIIFSLMNLFDYIKVLYQCMSACGEENTPTKESICFNVTLIIYIIINYN